jgi:FtsH-binding integral membrane protein
VEITGASVEDPIRSTFSEYVHTDQGARLVGVAMLLVGFAALSVAGALVRKQQARWLIGTFGVGLVLLAVFPQEPADMPLTWHGAIHRYVALTAFIALPVAALLLNDRVLRFLAVGSLTTLVVFVATFIPATETRAYSGLAERVLLAIDLVILVVMARHAAKRPAWQPPTRESESRS